MQDESTTRKQEQCVPRVCAQKRGFQPLSKLRKNTTITVRALAMKTAQDALLSLKIIKEWRALRL